MRQYPSVVLGLLVGGPFALAGCASAPQTAEVPAATVTEPAMAIPAAASGPPASHDGKVLLFGNLHAHSNLSDDIRPVDPDLSPLRAFAYADEHGLDFLAVSDHHKAVDSSHRLFLDPEEFASELRGATIQNSADHPDFIALAALEWGNTATGNHVNVIAPDELPPDAIEDADYDDLFAWAAGHAAFVQFNHPASWKRKSNRNRDVGNFGSALYATTEAYVAAVDPVVKTISVITTVQGGHISGRDRHSEEKVHRDGQWENLYREFLNMGFHLAPASNQDTHWRNWGTVTAARTAVWADAVSFGGLTAAFDAHRVYATEDDELAVVFQVRYDGTTTGWERPSPSAKTRTRWSS